MHEDQRQKDMEQLINGIDRIDKAWYLASVFLIGLAVLAVFHMIKR